MDIGEHIEAPDFSTYGKGTPATSYSALVLGSEPVGILSEHTLPSTIAPTLGIITISNKFL